MAVELATAYVSLVPSMKGFQSALARDLGGPSEKAGRDSGSRFGGRFTAAAKVAVAAGAGAVVAGLASAINLDAANDKLAAQLGLSQKESERIGGVAGQLYSNAYGDSMEGVNTAVRGVIQNIDGLRGASSDVLQDVTARALDLSTAFDEDVVGATRAVGVIMQNGLAPNAEAAFDVLTRGFQTGVNGSGDLLDTFTEYPALFARLGLDAQTSMGLLSQGLASGARNSDLVADALKEFQIRATDASETSAAGFETLGLNAEEMTAKIAAGGDGAAAGLQTVLDRLRETEDPVARNAAAVALFGTQAEDLGDALFSLDPSGAVDSLGQVAGASDRLGDTLNDNAKTNLIAFGRQVKTAFIDFLGGRALPAISEAARFLATNFGPAIRQVGEFITGTLVPGFRDLVGWIKENESWLKPIAAGVLAAAAAYKIWTTATAVWTAVTKGATAAQKALNLVMRANPIGIVIALLVGLAAGLKYAWDHSEAFRKVVTAVWLAVRNAATAAWNWIKTNVIDRFVAGLTWLWNTAVSVKNGIVTAWNQIRAGLGAAYTWIKSNVFDRYVAAGQWIWNKAVAVKNGVVGAWRSMRDGLRAVWVWIDRNVIRPIIGGFQDAWNKAVEVKDGIVSAWQTVSSSIGAAFGGIWDGIKGALNAVFGFINRWMIRPLNAILSPFGLEIPDLPKLHSGGFVPGKGEKPYMLLGGEAVLNPDATKRLGRDNIEALNSGRDVNGNYPDAMGGGWVPDWMQKVADGFTAPFRKGWEVLSGQWVDDAILEGVTKTVDAGLGFLRPRRDNSPRVPWRTAVGASEKFGAAMKRWTADFTGAVTEGKTGGVVDKSGPFAFPLPRGSYRVGGGLNSYPGHTGQDFPAPAGTPVFAPMAGRFSGINLGNRSYGLYGNVVASGLRFIAAHLSSLVGGNRFVRAGEMIGRVGSTGNSTGNHLHGEFRNGGRVEDPRKYLKFDDGGWLTPGAIGISQTARPEPVFTASQWDSISTLAAQGADQSEAITPSDLRDALHGMTIGIDNAGRMALWVSEMAEIGNRARARRGAIPR